MVAGLSNEKWFEQSVHIVKFGTIVTQNQQRMSLPPVVFHIVPIALHVVPIVSHIVPIVLHIVPFVLYVVPVVLYVVPVVLYVVPKQICKDVHGYLHCLIGEHSFAVLIIVYVKFRHVQEHNLTREPVLIFVNILGLFIGLLSSIGTTVAANFTVRIFNAIYMYFPKCKVAACLKFQMIL